MKTFRILVRCLVCSIAILFVHMSATTMFAAAGTSKPSRLDVLFLIDQSGSMGGADFGFKDGIANDPQGLRFAAPLAAIDILGGDASTLHKDADYRLGVISFGGRVKDSQPVEEYVETSIALLRLNPSGNGSPDQWRDLRTRLQGKYSKEAWKRESRNLGSTSFIEPMQRACREFTGSPGTADGNRVIIVITDGKPELPGGVALNQAEHFSQVKSAYKDCKTPRSKLFVIGLRTVSDNSGYWDGQEQYWKEIAEESSQVELIRSNDQLVEKIGYILKEQIDWGELVTDTSFEIQPLQEQLIIRIFKTDPMDKVVLFPFGRSEAITPPEVQVSDFLEVITVRLNPDAHQPGAGLWKLEKKPATDRSNVRVWLSQVPLNVNIDGLGDDFTQFSTYTFRVLIRDSLGAKKPPPEQFKLTGFVRIGAEMTPLQITQGQTDYEVAFHTFTSGELYLDLALKDPGKSDPIRRLSDTSPRGTVVKGRTPKLSVSSSPLILNKEREVSYKNSLPFWMYTLDETALNIQVQLVEDDAEGRMRPVAPLTLFEGEPEVKVSVTGPSRGLETTIRRSPGGPLEPWTISAGARLSGRYEVFAEVSGPYKRGIARIPDVTKEIWREDPPWRSEGQYAQILFVSVSVAALGSWRGWRWRNQIKPTLSGRLLVSAAGASKFLTFNSSINRQSFSGKSHFEAMPIKNLRVHSVSNGIDVTIVLRDGSESRGVLARGQTLQAQIGDTTVRATVV